MPIPPNARYLDPNAHKAVVHGTQGLDVSRVYLPGGIRLVASSHEAACILRDLINLHVNQIEIECTE